MDLLPLAVSVALVGPFGLVTAPTAPAPVAAPLAAVAAADDTTPAVRTDRPRAEDARGPWASPVDPLRVTRPFDAPAQKWLPGHRGVDLRAPAGTPVRAPAAGRVAFVGMVAGRPVLSIDHDDPVRPGGTLRTTYEPLRSTLIVGTGVRPGEVIGEVRDDSHCDGGCLHWGARRGKDYVDPLSLLRGPIRLWTPQTG